MTQTTPAAKSMSAAETVNADSTPYTYHIELSEYQGKCRISWSSNCPFPFGMVYNIPVMAEVRLYSGAAPSDPNKGIVERWPLTTQSGSVDAKSDWGSGWSAACVAPQFDMKLGPGYVVKTAVTKDQ